MSADVEFSQDVSCEEALRAGTSRAPGQSQDAPSRPERVQWLYRLELSLQCYKQTVRGERSLNMGNVLLVRNGQEMAAFRLSAANA